MADEAQYADGSYGGVRERDSLPIWRAGGYMGPAGSNTPMFNGGMSIGFNIGGGTDTAGGILSYVNNFGCDLIITAHQLDVTTVATGACTVSFGQTGTNGTTSSSNCISGQDVHSATGTFNGGALSVKWPAGTWITGSKASGASAGLVGRVWFDVKTNPAAGAV